MKAKGSSFWEWQKRYPDDATCLVEIATLRWPEGFQCPRCGHYGWQLNTRPVIECAHCHRQTSVITGTLFHASKVSLTQ
ncbi:MAG: transposase [Methylococcales bacterium]